MKYIEYEYVSSNEPNVDPALVARGQIKAEKNAAGQVVSSTSFPTSYRDPNLMRRTETRGDGRSRNFNYAVFGSGFWSTIWTDFKNQPFTTSYPVNFYGWTTTDARGNTTTYEREAVLGAVRKITYPQTARNQPAATKEYIFSDPAHPYFHSGEKDENGNWTYFDRDGNNRIWQTRYPDGSTEQFTYNGFGQVLTHKLRSGGTETCTYDARGLKLTSYPPATESDPDPWNHPTRYFYYQSGPNTDRLYHVNDPFGNATWFQYNQRGQVTKLTHQDGTYTQSEYNPDGTVAWTADENHPNASWNESERTRFTYDKYKRILTVTNPMGETTETCYALDAHWGDPLARQPLLHTTNTPKYTKSPMGKNVVYDYDENLRKLAQTVAAGTSDIATTWFDYDEAGNLKQVTDPRGKVTTFGYDQRNRKIWMDNPIPSDRNGTNHTMNWAYDGVGNKTRETRADDAFRSWQYDSMNRLWHAYDWRTNDPPQPNQMTTYDHTVDGRALYITDTKGAVYTHGFDAMLRKTSITYPPDATNASRHDAWYYDIAGNIQRHDNPAGQVQWFVYDDRNRQTDAYWWGYVGPHIITGYDAASRVKSITTTQNDVFETLLSFGYDDANRQISEEQTLAGYPTRRVETPRDADGNRNYLQVPGAYYVGYAYTQRNQLKAVNGFAHFDYDRSGNIVYRGADWIYPSGASYAFDDVNRVTQIDQGNAWYVFGRSHYQYDKAGREIATWRDGQDEPGGKGEWLRYNVQGQLVNARYNADYVWSDTPSSWDRWVDYGYTSDRLNRNSVTENGVVTSYSATAMNQYSVNGANYSYDGNFNQMSDGAGHSFGYNAQNQLVRGSMTATYDGLGRCVRRTTPGGTLLFTYDGWKPILEWGPAGNWTATNVYGAGADEILARQDSSGRILIYKQDQHGNVVAVLTDNGDVTEKYTYDAFGKPKIFDKWGNGRAATAIGNRFMFQGREWISELGIYDYRHRIYHPDLGRFLQTDPLGLQTEGAKLSAGQKALFSPGGVAPDAFGSSEMNLFRYCGDDPVDGNDPLGLELLGDNVPFEKVDFVTIQGADKYGGIKWDIHAEWATRQAPGGYTAFVNRLDVIILKAQIATKVQVKGEPWARQRTDDQVAATLHHEKDLHKEIGRRFDKENQNREFSQVYRTKDEAIRQAGRQLDRDWDKAQKHDERFQETMKKESFR